MVLLYHSALELISCIREQAVLYKQFIVLSVSTLPLLQFKNLLISQVSEFHKRIAVYH